MSNTTYQLTVYIAPDCLVALRSSGYSLCIAQEVSGKFDVVLLSTEQLLYENLFTFEERYRVFGTDKFQDGALVQATIPPQPISSGQEITLNPQGVFNNAVGTVNPSLPIQIHNKFPSPVHFGIQSFFGGNYSPAYVTELPFLSGTVFLRPERKLLVWFQQGLETGTMITSALFNCMLLDFTSTNNLVIKYTASGNAPSGGLWSTGAFPVLGQTYDPSTNTFALTASGLPGADLVAQMSKLLNPHAPIGNEIAKVPQPSSTTTARDSTNAGQN